MEMNLLCVLKWLLYVLALLNIIFAIALITTDQSDNKDPKLLADSPRSYTGVNLLLFLMYVCTSAPIIAYYFWPRPFLFMIACLLTVIFVICRLALPRHVHFEFMITPFFTGIISGLFVFLLLYRYKPEDQGYLATLWKPIDNSNLANGGSSAGGASESSHKAHAHKKSRQTHKNKDNKDEHDEKKRDSKDKKHDNDKEDK